LRNTTDKVGFSRERETKMQNPLRRGAAFVVACTALLLPIAAAGGAAAQAKIPRNTQPSNFTIGNADSNPATALVASNGTAYLAYTSTVTTKSAEYSSAYVCVLPRGARACSKTTLLPPLDKATSASDLPDSLLFGGDGTIDVLVTTYNDSNNDDRTSDGEDADTLEYVLNSAGTLQGSATRVGSLDSQGTAIAYKGQILWSNQDSSCHCGVALQETPSDGTFPHITDPREINLAGTPAASEFYFYGVDVVALPNSDLLFAWDDGSNAYDVEVNPASSFKVVGSSEFKNELTSTDGVTPTGALATGPAGTYLLLRSTNNGFAGKMETLKYTSAGHFAAPLEVVSPANDYGDFKLLQTGEGHLKVYYETFAGRLVQLTSANDGATWSTLDYASATPEAGGNIAPALLTFGAGVVFEASGGTPANGILPRVQPVLVNQAVSFNLKASSIPYGESTTASGTVSYADAGQVIDLQKDTGSSWVTVATTAEAAGGTYSFTIHTTVPGSTTYRAEASEVPGWFFTDDSANHTLTATKVSITTGSLPTATYGKAYSVQLKATGGSTPYVWSRTAGAMANGVHLSTSGLISGTPTLKEKVTFTAEAKSTYGGSASKVFTLTVS
jgi:hypothetical protein